jgi:hypothetical protein
MGKIMASCKPSAMKFNTALKAEANDPDSDMNPKFKSAVLAAPIKKKKGKGLKSACWKGYEAIGMKTKGGRKVPNCVKKK